MRKLSVLRIPDTDPQAFGLYEKKELLLHDTDMEVVYAAKESIERTEQRAANEAHLRKLWLRYYRMLTSKKHKSHEEALAILQKTLPSVDLISVLGELDAAAL